MMLPLYEVRGSSRKFLHGHSFFIRGEEDAGRRRGFNVARDFSICRTTGEYFSDYHEGPDRFGERLATVVRPV